jgi:hypothetical protein
MTTTKLRAVATNERGKSKPKTILAASAGDERTFLVALREKLAGEIDKGVPAHAVRGIVAEMRDLDRSIRAIDLHDDGDDITEATRVPDAAFDPAAI